MKAGVTCPECGTPRTDRIVGMLEGLCPGCLAGFATPERARKSIVGETRVGKFTLKSQLGIGASGEVWKAWDTVLARWVALKIFHAINPEDMARISREAQTAARLSHPNIAAVHDVGEENGRHFLAMQYVEGQTLANFPRRDIKLLVRLVRDAARAVGAAHAAGIIHRDLKPANLAVVRLPKERPGFHVYVLDFGLARPIEGGTVTATGIIVGTPAYMAPEQARGEELDGRADVYSLGATLYELFTGGPPFRGPNVYEVLRKVQEHEPKKPRALDARIPRDLETVVLKCLEKRPQNRYATAGELAQDLDRWLEGDAIVARKPSIAYRLRRILEKRKLLAAAVAVSLILAFGLTFLIPQWKAESAARMALEDRRVRLERARPHVESGAAVLQRMRLRIRSPYLAGDLSVLAAEARRHYDRALELAPGHPEALVGKSRISSMVSDRKLALEELALAIKSDADFAPAYLDRVAFRLDEFIITDLQHRRHGSKDSNDPRSGWLREQVESDLRRTEQLSKDYAMQSYARAMLRFADDDYRSAAAGLTEYLIREPEDARGHYWLGHALVHLNQHASAIKSLTRSLTFDTGYVAALLLRALARSELKLHEDAIADCTQAIALQPRNPTAYFNRAAIKVANGDIDGAILDNSEAIQINSTFASAYFNRAWCRGAKKRHPEAIADYDQVILLEPRNAGAFYNRAREKLLQRDYADALSDYEESIRLDSSTRNANAYFGRGHARIGLGRYKDAIEDYTTVIARNDKSGEAFICRAHARSALELHREAVEDLTRAIEIGPDTAELRYNRGNAQLALRSYAEAVEDYTEAIRLNAAHSMALTNRGLARERLGAFAEAMTDYSTAIEWDPRRAEAFLNRGSLRAEKGMLEEAIADLEQGLRLLSPNAQARRGFEKLLGANRARLENREAAALQEEAHQHWQANRVPEAVKTLEKLVGRWPSTKWGTDAAYNLACAHVRLKDKTTALEWLEKAVELGYRAREHLEEDPDLEPLRTEARYRRLIEKLKQE